MAFNVKIPAKIISIIYFIISLSLFILAILSFISPDFIDINDSNVKQFSVLAISGNYFSGILFFIFSAVSFVIALGLWRFKNWARVISIIFCILAIISSFISIFRGKFISIFYLILNLAIFYFLGFYKKQLFH